MFFFWKNHWIRTVKMDFHPPFLGESSVQLPKWMTLLETRLKSKNFIAKCVNIWLSLELKKHYVDPWHP
jgi:hypothetical protein